MSKVFRPLIVTAILIATGCSGAALKSEWEEQRGYTESDVNAIMNQFEIYKIRLIQAQQASNAFNTAPYDGEKSRLKAIFCTCVKRMGARCRQKSTGLSGPDKDLWIKSNAVDMAMGWNHTDLDAGPRPEFDLAECQ